MIFLEKHVQSCLPFHHQPSTISWIPAHKLEHLPISMISTELAEAHGTTVRHNIERNRTADYIAKEFANRMTPLNDGFGKRLEAAAL